MKHPRYSMKQCLCETPNKALYNKHYKGRTIDMSLLSDDDGYAVIVYELGEAIAVFDIAYCPECGVKLGDNYD